VLWRGFYDSSASSALLVPILIIAAGQLAGSLAWLAISGEDAPDLIASTPVTNVCVVRAKTEAVTGVIAIIFGPFIRRMSRLLEIGPWRGSPEGAPARGRCRWLIEFGAAICLTPASSRRPKPRYRKISRSSPLMVWMSMDNNPEALADGLQIIEQRDWSPTPLPAMTSFPATISSLARAG